MKYLLTISLVTNIIFISIFISTNYDHKLEIEQQLELPAKMNVATVYLFNNEASEKEIQELNMQRLVNGHIHGVTYLTDDGCVIYAETPRSVGDRERMATLGHELLHCYLGQYHAQ